MEEPTLEYIQEISGGNEEFEQKFVTILQDEFPKEKEAYLEYLGKQNLEEASKVVHKIKHKFGILSMTDSYRLAVSYEEELKEGQRQLEEEFTEILEAVHAFIKEL